MEQTYGDTAIVRQLKGGYGHGVVSGKREGVPLGLLREREAERNDQRDFSPQEEGLRRRVQGFSMSI